MGSEKNIREAIRWFTTAEDAETCITYSRKIIDEVRLILHF